MAKKTTESKFQPITDGIQKVIDKLPENLGMEFIGSCVILDEEKIENNEKDITAGDIIFAYGGKESLLIQLEALIDVVKNSKEDFINW